MWNHWGNSAMRRLECVRGQMCLKDRPEVTKTGLKHSTQVVSSFWAKTAAAVARHSFAALEPR